MSLTPTEVKKIAHLARLHIPEEKIAPLRQDLEQILTLVAQMDQVNTNAIEPMAHPLDEVQPLRSDQVIEVNQRELFQQIAPQTSAGLYIVPQVIETEE